MLQQHDSARSAGEVPPTYSASEQQMLRLALSNTPFEVFRHKAFARDDSEENVAKQLRREHEDRMHQVCTVFQVHISEKDSALTKTTLQSDREEAALRPEKGVDVEQVAGRGG